LLGFAVRSFASSSRGNSKLETRNSPIFRVSIFRRDHFPLRRLDGQLAGGERGPDLGVAPAHLLVSRKRAAAGELGVIFAEVVEETGGNRRAADPERGLELAARHRARGQGPVAGGGGGNGRDGRRLQGRAGAVRLRP